MTKEELRQKYILKRQSLTREEYLELSLNLCNSFFAHIDLVQVSVIHTFLPIEKNKEPDTWLIIHRLQHEYPDIRISIPRANPETGELDNFYFEGPQQLQKSPWGIPEPHQGNPTPLEEIDIVIVPMLTFDPSGHRVGYGKGYYDKFLARCRKNVLKVGLSLFPPEPALLESDPHDIPLDMGLTPDAVYKF